MNNISFESFKELAVSREFLNRNNALGYLRIYASVAKDALPLEGVNITIYKIIGNYKVIFYRGKTDSSGVIDNIVLPAPRMKNIASLEVPDYTTYQIEARKDKYYPILDYIIGIFGNIKNEQDIVLQPIINIEEN